MNFDHLRKGSGPNFTKELESVPMNLSIENVEVFFSISIKLLKSDIPESSMSLVISSLCRSLCCKQFLDVFVTKKCIRRIPFDNVSLQEQLLDLFYIVVKYAPRSVGPSTAKKFSNIIKLNARKCLTILAIYGKQFDILLNPWPLLDLLFKEATYFRRPDCCEDYISLLVYLCQKFVDFKESRQQHCWGSICEALKSDNESILLTSYYALCSIYEFNPEIVRSFNFPSAQVAIHLRKPSLTKAALSLLYRTQPINHCSSLVQALIELAQKENNASYVLAKMATERNIARILLHDATWMTKELPTIVDTMRIFAALLTHPHVRTEILKKDEAIDFFRNAISYEFEGVIPSVCTFIRRLNVNKEYIKKLSSSDFLSEFFSIALNHENDEATTQAIILLVDTIAKVCFVRELVTVCKFINDLVLLENGFFQQAAKVALELCQYYKCACKFEELKLNKFFERKQKDSNTKKLADAFLKEYEKAIKRREENDEEEDSSSSSSDKESKKSTKEEKTSDDEEKNSHREKSDSSDNDEKKAKSEKDEDSSSTSSSEREELAKRLKHERSLKSPNKDLTITIPNESSKGSKTSPKIPALPKPNSTSSSILPGTLPGSSTITPPNTP